MNNNTIIILLVVLVLLSAFFSATETAFSSLNKVRLKYLANNGNKKAQKTLKLADDFTSLLSTILIGNNIVNITASSLSTVLFINMFGENGVSLSTLVMTIIILIFGEITPKSIAKEMPESYAMTVCSIISVLNTILKPVNFFFDRIKRFASLAFKNKEEDNSMISEEFLTMVEDAQEEGDMDEHEADLITNAIEFNDLDVRDILTPRVDVVAVDVEDYTMDEIKNLYRDHGYSRLPVYEGSIDNIIGVIHEKDFYFLYYTDTATTLRQMIKPVIYTSPHVKISALLRQLQSTKSHMAIVIDEYGGTAGIITMEDILEELVGEIYDEHDEVVEYYKKLDDHTFLVKGDTDIDDLFKHFDIHMKEEYNFNTTSGWVIHNMDKIPLIGEGFDFKNMHITVTDADNKKVNEIKIEFHDDVKEDE